MKQSSYPTERKYKCSNPEEREREREGEGERETENDLTVTGLTAVAIIILCISHLLREKPDLDFIQGDFSGFVGTVQLLS